MLAAHLRLCTDITKFSSSFLFLRTPLSYKSHTGISTKSNFMSSTLGTFFKSFDCTFVRELSPDPEGPANAPNRRAREVKRGHYVLVRPTPIENPELVVYSPGMLRTFGLTDEDARSPDFLRFFSGGGCGADDASSSLDHQAWATPYALSIYGSPIDPSPDPFGTGNGYGDGRAIYVGEVVVGDSSAPTRWDVQLKGSGPTPFCRGADGRAVLRSSLREFVASEAMGALGVRTAQSLCVIRSLSETVQRPWYSPGSSSPSPNIMIREPIAITTRVAPSLLRVGHIEVHARRAVRDSASIGALSAIVEYALHREFDSVPACDRTLPFAARVLGMAAEFRARAVALAVDWIRVGYCQGNFNSDNCLLGGRTMDYGPFGFIEQYDPKWCMWTGGQGHYAFINQVAVALQNFATLCSALVPLLSSSSDADSLRRILQEAPSYGQQQLHVMFRRKLGLAEECPTDVATAAITGVLASMEFAKCDYTIFFRTLSNPPFCNPFATLSDDEIAALLGPTCYVPLSGDAASRLIAAVRQWWTALQVGRAADLDIDIGKQMRSVNPKYIPREWMLVDMYEKAAGKDYSALHEIHEVLLSPYDEQSQYEEKYFRLAPSGICRLGGTTHMT